MRRLVVPAALVISIGLAGCSGGGETPKGDESMESHLQGLTNGPSTSKDPKANKPDPTKIKGDASAPAATK